ncbi:hypothetical protein GCM10027318_37310 [Massilia agilis]
MLDFDVVLEHDVADGFAGRRFHDRALGAKHRMGQEYELWHFCYLFGYLTSFPRRREPIDRVPIRLSMGSRLRGNDVV